VKVWVNETFCGHGNSLSTPRVYDLSDALTPGIHRLTILVDNAKVPPVGPAHAIDERNQTNWNGIIGKIELRVLFKRIFGAILCSGALLKREESNLLLALWGFYVNRRILFRLIFPPKITATGNFGIWLKTPVLLYWTILLPVIVPLFSCTTAC